MQPVRTAIKLGIAICATIACTEPRDLPVVPDVTFVLAVANHAAPAAVSADEITLTAFIDGSDAAVQSALVRDFGVDAARLAIAGHGARRPIESNDTLAGRARNRCVELVCMDASG